MAFCSWFRLQSIALVTASCVINPALAETKWIKEETSNNHINEPACSKITWFKELYVPQDSCDTTQPYPTKRTCTATNIITTPYEKSDTTCTGAARTAEVQTQAKCDGPVTQRSKKSTCDVVTANILKFEVYADDTKGERFIKTCDTLTETRTWPINVCVKLLDTGDANPLYSKVTCLPDGKYKLDEYKTSDCSGTAFEGGYDFHKTGVKEGKCVDSLSIEAIVRDSSSAKAKFAKIVSGCGTTTAAPTTAAPTTLGAKATTTKAATSEAAAPTKVVTVVMTLKHIDFDKVQANSTVKTKLVDGIKQAFLSRLTGYTMKDLTVELTKGSIVATVKITPKAGSDSATLKNTVKTEKSNLVAASLSNVKAVSGVNKFLAAGKALTDITATATFPVEVTVTTDPPSISSTVEAAIGANVIVIASLLTLASF